MCVFVVHKLEVSLEQLTNDIVIRFNKVQYSVDRNSLIYPIAFSNKILYKFILFEDQE